MAAKKRLLVVEDKVKDLSKQHKDLEAQNAAGLLIILPKDLNSYSPEQRAVIKI